MSKFSLFSVFLPTIVVFLLTSCGFHLGDTINIPTELKTIYVKVNSPYSHFSKQLQQTLLRQGITQVNSPSKAPFTLDILSNHQQITAVSRVNTAKPNIYQLAYHIVFSVISKENDTLVAAKSLTATTLLTLPDNTPVNSNSQTIILFNKLQQQVINELLNYLSSANIKDKLKQSLATQQTVDIKQNSIAQQTIKKTHETLSPSTG